MKKLFIIAIITGIIGVLGFMIIPDTVIARKFGGTIEIKVEPGYKVTMATFKNSDLFYMIEPIDSGYKPKVKRLIEKSKYGLIEAEVKFVESYGCK